MREADHPSAYAHAREIVERAERTGLNLYTNGTTLASAYLDLREKARALVASHEMFDDIGGEYDSIDHDALDALRAAIGEKP